MTKKQTATTERSADFEVVKTGNLTRDLELAQGADTGKPYARTGLAVERPKTDEGWKGELETEFYEVVVFDTVAEHAAESLHKGDRVVVVGRGEIETWTDNDGNERKTKKIRANEIAPSLRWATVDIRKTNGRKKPAAVKTSAADDDEDF